MAAVKWTAWECERHRSWFGVGLITSNAVDCIEQDCRVLVFIGSTTADNENVRRLLFSDAYRWVPGWDVNEMDGVCEHGIGGPHDNWHKQAGHPLGGYFESCNPGV